MLRPRVAVVLPVFLALAMSQTPAQVRYPDTRKADQVDDYFGRKVADPYRWLEDDNSPETAAWVEAQNKVTFDYLAKIPAREPLKARLTTLWNFERYGTPSREGEFYIFARNDGLQNQSVVYRAKTLDAAPEVLIDPNTLSADGTVALADTAFTDDGRLMAYALAKSGSDWHEWRVREVATGKDLPDVVEWSKFSGAAWLKDGSGFYYGRFDAPKAGDELQALNQNQRIYFHKIRTPQTADTLVYERPDHPTWGFSPVVTDDGRYLLLYQSEGTENKNRIFVQDLSKPGSTLQPWLDHFDGLRVESKCIKRTRGGATFGEDRVGDDLAQIFQIGLDPAETRMRQRALQLAQCFPSIRAFDDDLGEHGVVVGWNLAATFDPCFDPRIGWERDLRKQTTAREKAAGGILRIQARLDGGSTGLHAKRLQGQHLSCRLPHHPFD